MKNIRRKIFRSHVAYRMSLTSRNGFTPPPKNKLSRLLVISKKNVEHINLSRKTVLVGGFTLVETIIYAVILSGFLLIAFMVTAQVFESSRRVRIVNNVSDETEFIAKKIDWAMADASSTFQPAVSSTGATLTVNKTGFAQNPLVFSSSGTDAYLSRASGTAVRLNSDQVQVILFSFSRSYDALNNQTIVRSDIALQNSPEPDQPNFFTSTTAKTSYQY